MLRCAGVVISLRRRRFRDNGRGARLFNSGLEGTARRAIDIRKGDKIDEETFKSLVRAAVVFNTSLRGGR